MQGNGSPNRDRKFALVENTSEFCQRVFEKNVNVSRPQGKALIISQSGSWFR